MNLEEKVANHEELINRMAGLIARLSLTQLKLVEHVVQIQHKLDLAEATASDFEE